MAPHKARTRQTAADTALVPALVFGENELTVRALLRRAKALLGTRAEAGDLDDREAALEAEVLLAHILGMGRAQLLARPECQPSPADRQRYAALLERRLRGEPVAYLVGHREFFGLDFLVDRRVLVPRPETELLVEQALGEAYRLAIPAPRLADVGTGSGAIAISLAKRLPAATIYATDVSAAALAVAAANCRRHRVVGSVTLLNGDLLAPLPTAVHIIVANLPYISPEEFAALAPEVAEYEPRLALLAAEDGLALYRRLLAQAPAYVLPGGAIILEIAPQQAPAALAVAKASFPTAEITLGKDYAGRERVCRLRLPDED